MTSYYGWSSLILNIYESGTHKYKQLTLRSVSSVSLLQATSLIIKQATNMKFMPMGHAYGIKIPLK